MDWKLVLQIAGVVLGLLYLWLEYRADIRLWVVGLIMPLVHGALYYKAGLYADCSMQAYYVLAGLYGWIVWHNAPRRKAAADRIGHTPLRQAAGLIAVYAAAHTGIYFLLVGFTNSTVLGRDDHGRKHRGDVDALAQVRRAMARMAGRRPGNGGVVPLQGHPADGRPVRPLLGAGSRGLPSLESKNARIAIRPQNDGRPSPAAGTAFAFRVSGPLCRVPYFTSVR